MKKPLTPLATGLIAAAALLVVLVGGLLYLNRPSGGLTDEEVKQFQQKPKSSSPPATAPATGAMSTGPSSSDFPPGGPGAPGATTSP